MNLTTVEGDFSADDARFAIVSSRWNAFVVDALVEGAADLLRRHGVANERVMHVKVPGA